ncbi:MAG TPA: hypothetical protein PLP63_06830 [Saprospiraceae bacterium]|nr:hypothetical protein [Saprospiraceae bacterium]
MALFKKNTVSIGKIKKGQQGIPVYWQFDEIRRKDIATYTDGNGVLQYAVEKTCTCQGEILASEEGLTMMYNDKKDENKTSPFKKQITIYLADPTKKVRVINERGLEDFNKTLGYIVLYFEGEIG